MATATTTTPNDANATADTISFIESLQGQLTTANTNLSQKQQKLTNAKALKSTLNDQYSTALASANMASKNLSEAEKAQTQIDTITEFFEDRTTVVATMVDTATTTAEKMYEATQFIGTYGLERVDEILSAALSYNKADTADPTSQWTNTFLTAVQGSSAKGQTALNAAVKATKSSFTTLVSSLLIQSRTLNYYNQCQTYQKNMADLVVRLSNEYILLQGRAEAINQKLQTATANVALLTAEVATASFTAAQLQAEYTAAQKGASYIASAAATSKASSN